LICHAQFKKSSMFSLRNCLRVFHAEPHVPVDVPLDELRYTQCTVKSVFSHGSHAGLPLQTTVDELVSLALSPQSEPMVLNVVLHKGKLFTLNNRRLWCLKQFAEAWYWCRQHVFVRVLKWPLARGVLFNGIEICDQFCRALTTTSEGTSVELWSEDCEPQFQHQTSVVSSISIALDSRLAQDDVTSGAPFAIAEHEAQTEAANLADDREEGIDSAVTEQAFRPPSPVAALSPDEAAEIAGERWASWVQHRAWDALLQSEHLPAKLVVLRFSRHEHALDEVVLESKVAKRAAMQGADLCPTWARGAKVLLPDVGPELFDQDLEHFNVVVKEADEHELLRELEEKLPHRNRQLKPGCGRSIVPDKLSLFNMSQEDASSSNDTVFDVAGMRVFRTFIDIPRVKCQIKSSSSW